MTTRVLDGFGGSQICVWCSNGFLRFYIYCQYCLCNVTMFYWVWGNSYSLRALGDAGGPPCSFRSFHGSQTRSWLHEGFTLGHELTMSRYIQQMQGHLTHQIPVLQTNQWCILGPWWTMYSYFQVSSLGQMDRNHVKNKTNCHLQVSRLAAV